MRDVLTVFLEASAASGAWPAALHAWHTSAASGAPLASTHAVLLARSLARSTRWSHAAQLLSNCVPACGPAATAHVAAETALAMRSRALCRALAANPALCDALPVAGAAPVFVRALQHCGEWRRCLLWWAALPPGGAMRRHLRLSSHVAVCAAGAGQWAVALNVIEEAAAHDPPRAVLFALRAMRVAGKWEAAVRIYGRDKGVWRESPAAREIEEVMTRQNAESWVPADVLCKLRNDTP